MWPERTVDGYLFYSAEDAQLAAQEKKKGEYLDKYLDYHNEENVLKVYKKAIAEHIFKTPVGYDYLRKMQKFLLESGKFTEEDVPPIPLQHSYNLNVQRRTRPQAKTVSPQEEKKAAWPRVSLIANLILAVAVIAMFIITLQSDNPNILNYERTLVNRYASWEQSLSEREQAVREKERELQIEFE